MKKGVSHSFVKHNHLFGIKTYWLYQLKNAFTNGHDHLTQQKYTNI